MLENLRKFRNLGTPIYFSALGDLIRNSKDSAYPVSSISNYFFNRMIEGRTNFDGCIPLAIEMGLVLEHENNSISITTDYENILDSGEGFKIEFIRCLFSKLESDSELYEIFDKSNLQFDLRTSKLTITNSAFKLKNNQFKQLLLDFHFLEPVPNLLGTYFISYDYIDTFRGLFLEGKKHLNVDDLIRLQEEQRRQGEAAELFIIKYEEIRLGGKRIPLWVAEFSVSHGYDIASYINQDSKKYDRFIEVKSFKRDIGFYWSINEVNQAKLKGDRYFLYLVDFAKINQEGYEPTIIQNPYKYFFEETSPAWDLSVEKYYFRKL